MNGHSPLDGIDTTPYQGRQQGLRDMQAAVQERSRRMAGKLKRDSRLIGAVLLMGCLLVPSYYTNLWQARTGVREVPYVVLMDHLGNVQPLLRMDDLPVTPEQSQIMGTLMGWVESVRRISSDPVVLGQHWEKVEEFTSDAALNQLAEFRQEQKMRQQMGRRVATSTPTVRAPRKGRTYTVFWDEVAYDKNGQPIPEESGRWEAGLTIGDFQGEAAKKARDLRLKQQKYRNLLGIIVDDISWTGRPFVGQVPSLEGH